MKYKVSIMVPWLFIIVLAMTSTLVVAGNDTSDYVVGPSDGGNSRAVNTTPSFPLQNYTGVSSLCGGTLNGSGYIRSLNYPANYNNNLHCNWTLYASPYYGNIVLQFYALNTEQCCDFVSIYNRSGLINRYSGTSVPATIVLGDAAVVTFDTDGTVVYGGFSIWFSTAVVSATTPSSRDSCERQGNFYCAFSNLCVAWSQRCNGYSYCYYGEDEVGCSTMAPTAASSSCGGTLYGSGYVRSPNYPAYYNSNLRCNWTLIAQPYYGTLVLQFYAFNTESCCDFLSIYNSSRLVIQYSGSSVPASLVLGSTATVIFTTDGSVVNSGFELYFTTSVVTATTLSPRDSCQAQGNFYCALSNLCVPSWRRCDGYTYCYYGEDEAGCSSSPTTRTLVTTTISSPRDICQAQGNFYCALSNLCVPYWRRCDGYTYCYYGEDEVGCSSSSTTRTLVTTTTLSPRDSCQAQGNFYCALSNLCVPYWRRCDGYSHCYYGEDEAGCSSSSTTRAPSTTPALRDVCLGRGFFYCEYSRQCIAYYRRCDSYTDCYYGEDESGCGTSSTTYAPDTRRTSGQPSGSFFDAQAFLAFRKSSARVLSQRGCIVAFGCVAAVLLRIPRWKPHRNALH